MFRLMTYRVAFPTDKQLPVPLYERSGEHAVSYSELLEFQSTSLHLTVSVGEKYQLEDNGPSAEELQRELDWLLDDAIQAARKLPSQVWEDTTWVNLQRTIRDGREEALPTELLLRESLEYLSDLWRARIEERVPFQ
ncbi:hypothetical protein CYMTET_36182, partial [Cymbomonas tetramitiformis]